MNSIRLISTDRAAVCKGCQLPIVWRVGLIRPLQMRDGLEHVCASYVKTGKRRYFGGRRAVAPLMTAPDVSELEAGTVLKRGGKRLACKTCGCEGLEWLQVATPNGAKWFYVPFGTTDTSGTFHVTRPEFCNKGSTPAPTVAPIVPAPKPATRRRAVKTPQVAPLDGMTPMGFKGSVDALIPTPFDGLTIVVLDITSGACEVHVKGVSHFYGSRIEADAFVKGFATAMGMAQVTF